MTTLTLTEEEFDLVSGALYAQEGAAREQGHIPYLHVIVELQANIEAQWCAQANQEELI